MKIYKEKIKSLRLTPVNSAILSGLLVLLMYAILAVLLKAFPFGTNSYLESDLMHQYYNFLVFYTESIKNGEFHNLIFSFNRGIGGGGLLFFYYYLSSPLNLILLAFSKENIDIGIILLIWLRASLSAVTCSLLVSRIRNKASDIKSIVIPVAYALGSFAYLYNINIMWTDAIILLPLLIMAIHDLIEKGTKVRLICLLTVLFFSNFYMGYIVGLFLLIYISCTLIFENQISKKDKKSILCNFLLSALCAGAIFGIGATPVIMELKEFSAVSSTGNDLFTNVSALNTVLKLFMNSYDALAFSTIKSSPYIYSSILMIISAVYFFIKSPDKKMKKVYSTILLIYLIVIFIKPLDTIFHAFDTPNGFLQRYSFIINLIIVLCGVKGLDLYEQQEEENKNIYALLVISGIFLVFTSSIVLKMFAEKELYLETLVINNVIIILYLVAFIAPFKRGFFTFRGVLMVLLFTEVLLNAYTLSLGTNLHKESSLQVTNNIDKNNTYQLIEEIQENDKDFYRIGSPTMTDYIIKNSDNDSYVKDFYSVGEFNSALNKRVLNSLSKFGAEVDTTVFYALEPDLLMNAFMSVKYVVSKNEYDIYNKVHTYKTNIKSKNENDDIFLYENPYPLSLGFMSNKDVLKINPKEMSHTIYENQDALMNSILGTKNKKFHYKKAPKKVEVNNIDYKKDKNGNYIASKKNQEEEASIKFYYSEEPGVGQFMLYDRQEMKTKKYYPKVKVNGENFWHVTATPIVNIGRGESVVEVIFEEDRVLSNYNLGTFNATYYHIDETKEALSSINRNSQLENININKNKISGTINVKNSDDVLFTSIPYYDSWKVLVNGKKVKPVSIIDAFIGLELEEGLNEIELIFVPNGIYLGTFITLSGLVMFAVIIRKEKLDNKRCKETEGVA